jgi:hypothetical protein
VSATLALGKGLTALVAFICFINMVCFAHYASTFPDIRRPLVRKAGEGGGEVI